VANQEDDNKPSFTDRVRDLLDRLGEQLGEIVDDLLSPAPVPVPIPVRSGDPRRR